MENKVIDYEEIEYLDKNHVDDPHDDCSHWFNYIGLSHGTI
jgi:hypothetical protein